MRDEKREKRKRDLGDLAPNPGFLHQVHMGSQPDQRGFETFHSNTLYRNLTTNKF